ncbi:restriction endonuclease subunit S [Perlabentimonas gracilis]|uniref:restriction endonuclease subunit S n=1 Tax=Perlabentimonas gracilis TaxID=2715279 RepID=UPI00140D3995|nr:restriction endonuclease subunit S [Perlabentimonas gracilis]NHB70218.1 restriction endonuclease subunit S [Perlabentimonas gracilis]
MKKYEKYKDSGIEWIGEIPEHWEVKSLKRLAKICNGQDHKEVWDENGIYPIFGTGGEFGKANKYLHKGTSVLLGRKGTIDKPQYIQEPFWSVDTAYYTEIKPDVNPKLFYYLCTTIRFDFYKYGSAVPSMTQEVLSQIPFPISLSYEEQTAIANYLDRKTAEIDQLIDAKKRLIELYHEEKTAIINQAVTKGINPNAKMKDSGIEWLGEVPEHWEVKRIKQLVSKVGSGVTPSGGASVYQTSGIPLLRSQNIHFDGLKLDDVAYISEDIHNDMSNSKVNAGDVLINITGASIGRTFYVEEWLGEANVNQHVCIIRPKKQISSVYLYYLLRSNIGQEQIRQEQTGSGREGLTFEAIKKFVIPFVEIEEQQSIVHHIVTECSRIDTKIERTQRLIELLAEYRTALISEVVTGKVKVV